MHRGQKGFLNLNKIYLVELRVPSTYLSLKISSLVVFP